tara:strand:- start:93 stop:659 length:567 start_codon:yes stop_codon:yes gene_type:complete
MNLKKAAMFGLDARIALAIFGALSVISGAALYSAIQQSKATAVLAEFREIEKAVEQYYLDTGTIMPYFDARDLSVLALINEPSGVTNWNGPYLPFAQHLGEDKLVPVFAEKFAVIYRDKTSPTTTCTKAMDYCYIYIWYKNDSDDIGKSIDLMVDGVDDKASGAVQYGGGAIVYKTNIIYPSANAQTS